MPPLTLPTSLTGIRFSSSKLMGYVAQKPSRLFGLALAWGVLMAAFGFLPGLSRGASLISISFDLRDYLLRAFVVFLVAHIFVRQTSLPVLLAIPAITFALWQGIDVYDFSEWFSQRYRVNLHELNAQLFVVPVQITVAIIGLVLCLRKSTKTTSRLFATIMMWGSIISTLLFHLSIVEVSYKPVESVYADMLRRTSQAEDYRNTCEVMSMECESEAFGTGGFETLWALDPQLRLKQVEMMRLLATSHTWVARDQHGVMQMGLASVDHERIRYATTALPTDFTWPLEDYSLNGASCPAGAGCAEGNETISQGASNKLSGVLATAEQVDQFAHAWIEGLPTDGKATLWLRVLGKVDGITRLTTKEIPPATLEQLSHNLTMRPCAPPACVERAAAQIAASTASNPGLAALAKDVHEGRYTPLYFSWVDKALSRNPVKYIDRPEFLRSMAYSNGKIRITTTPKSFSSITLDMKITFNLIITIFSTSWLVLGVFLILFHTRRALIPR